MATWLLIRPLSFTVVLPGAQSDRLRFVTAGEDKALFLWSRSRSSGHVTTDRIVSEHTSMITGLDHVPSKNWIISGAKDRRVSVVPLAALWTSA